MTPMFLKQHAKEVASCLLVDPWDWFGIFFCLYFGSPSVKLAIGTLIGIDFLSLKMLQKRCAGRVAKGPSSKFHVLTKEVTPDKPYFKGGGHVLLR